MSFQFWLFDRFWKRRAPRAALAGGGLIPYGPLVAEEVGSGSSRAWSSEGDSREDPEHRGTSPEGWTSDPASGGETSPPDDEDRPDTEDVSMEDVSTEDVSTEDASTEEPDEEDDEQADGEDAPDERLAPRVIRPGSLPVELYYLDELIRFRIGQVLHPHLGKVLPPMPPVQRWQLPIGEFIIDYNRSIQHQLTDDDARLLLIALVEHVQPDLFDYSINGSLKGEGDFQPIGGARGKNFRGFIPTGQTAVFLLGGANWEHDLTYQKLFWADHVFAKNRILWLGDVEQGEPTLSGRIILSQDYVDILLHNKVVAPHHNINFPAKLVSTNRERDQLVINAQLNSDFEHVLDWVRHKEAVEKKWADGKKGFRCLFHGPSGTGKTFATCILGKETGREVYRIDLSLVVSKFIGETEKNLELIFARAENKNWILFFDEADALFGKRTNIRDAHDKYANQEASYLLQRIEDYDGLVVLATNMKNNIDESFLRRFDSDLKFSMPGMEDRKKIWKQSFPEEATFAREESAPSVSVSPENKQFYRYVRRHKEAEGSAIGGEVMPSVQTAQSAPVRQLDIPDLVKGYALSGGNIQNVVHYATIRATKRQAEEKQKRMARGENAANQPEPPLIIYLEDVQNGIKREMSKNGIPFTNKKRQTWDNPQRD